MMPNFLVIGAERSGTTSLHHYLHQHPEVYMSPAKEPKFFAFEGQDLDFRGPRDQQAITHWLATTLDDYQALFAGVSGETAVGETSPMYLYVPEAAPRIRRYVPEARLIAVLRNPVDRAYSAYLRKVQEKREDLDFDQALEKEEARIASNWAPGWGYKRNGLYHAQLRRYYRLFDREQIRVYLYESFQADPLGMLQDIFRFIEVDDTFAPDTSNRHNVAGGLWKRNLGKAPALSRRIRRDLTRVYRSDILELQGLIGRDLSAWLGEGA